MGNIGNIEEKKHSNSSIGRKDAKPEKGQNMPFCKVVMNDDESELFSLTGGFRSQVFNCQSLRFVQIDMNCVIYHNLSHRQIILLSYDEAQEKKPFFVKTISVSIKCTV